MRVLNLLSICILEFKKTTKFVYRIASNKRPGADSGLEISVIVIFVECLPPAFIQGNTVSHLQRLYPFSIDMRPLCKISPFKEMY